MMLEMVSGETVCVWNLVCGEGFSCVDFRGASGREILGKEGEGKDGLHGFVGRDTGRPRENKRGPGVGVWPEGDKKNAEFVEVTMSG
jgi:hypothetical protein